MCSPFVRKWLKTSHFLKSCWNDRELVFQTRRLNFVYNVYDLVQNKWNCWVLPILREYQVQCQQSAAPWSTSWWMLVNWLWLDHFWISSAHALWRLHPDLKSEIWIRIPISVFNNILYLKANISLTHLIQFGSHSGDFFNICLCYYLVWSINQFWV